MRAWNIDREMELALRIVDCRIISYHVSTRSEKRALTRRRGFKPLDDAEWEVDEVGDGDVSEGWPSGGGLSICVSNRGEGGMSLPVFRLVIREDLLARP